MKRLFMMAICVLMYAVATAHWAITMKWLHDVFEFVEDASATYEGVTPKKLPTFPDCTQTVLLAVNVRTCLYIQTSFIYANDIVFRSSSVISLFSSGHARSAPEIA